MKYPISEKIATSLIHNGIINSEDKDLYTYGLKQGAHILLNLITTIVISLYLQMFWQGIIFMLAFIPLRSYGGGYHAKTQLRCYLFSTVTFAGVLLLTKLISWTNQSPLIVAIGAGIIVFVLAPIEDLNKPLDQIEITVYKKRTRFILCFLEILVFLFWYLGKLQISVCIAMSLALVAVMLILGKIKNSYIHRQNNSKFI